MKDGMKMAANIDVPTRGEIERHLLGHDWTEGEVSEFMEGHADKVGVLTYDEWEDLTRGVL
jgi:hypothetical protein